MSIRLKQTLWLKTIWLIFEKLQVLTYVSLCLFNSYQTVYQQNSIICQVLTKLLDNTVVEVWLDLGTKKDWLGLGIQI